MRTFVTIFFTLLLSANCLADDLTIPNTFTAGTPARAAEVNANFTAVEASVDDNAADIAASAADVTSNAAGIAENAASIASNAAGIAENAAAASNPATIKWLANGSPIGSFIAFKDNNFYHNDAAMLTFEDYYVSFSSSDGRIEAPAAYLVYLEPGCQGQAYIFRSSSPNLNSYFMNQGAVIRSPFSGDPIRLYYWETGSVVIENQTFVSNLSEATGCSNGDSAVDKAYPVYPNDPAITGVSAEFFELPLSFGHR